MTTQTLLNKYPFSKHFYVTFALNCANEVRHLLKDPRSIKALDMTALWLKGGVSDQEMKVVADDAYDGSYAAYTAATYAATYAAYDAAYTAAYAATYDAASAAYAATAATAAHTSRASYTASYAGYDSPLTKDDCYLLLIKTIKDYYSPFELEMFNIDFVNKP